MTNKLPVVIAGMNYLSGVTTWGHQLRAALADHARYEVRLLYIGPEQPESFDIRVPTIEAAQQRVRELAPVIVLPNYVWELFLTGFEPGVYCVGMCHADSDEQYYNPLSWYEPVISQFIAVSRECSERLTQRIPFRAENIATLPYGICVPPTLNRNYQTEPLRLIYAGRVTQLQKRVWDFVPLVEHLLKLNIHFVFDIIGEGDQFLPLQETMQARFPAGYVRFYPRVPYQEMPGLWSDHDVFIQVSDFEGTSVSMLEAMAHGVVPVITAASSGIEGVIYHQENGFIAPVSDMVALAQHVAQLAADQALLARAGRAAYKTAQAYSMERYTEKFTQFLDQVVQSGQEIDLGQRYGMFAIVHPLFKQQTVIHQLQAQIYQQQERVAQLEVQIAHRSQGLIKQLLRRSYQSLFPLKMRLFFRNLRIQLLGR